MLGQVSAYNKNCYLTVVQIYVITINFGSETCQIKVGIVQVNTKSALKMLISDCTYIHTIVTTGMVQNIYLGGIN